MALVWVAYLNLFLWEFRSHRRVRVFIQLHGGYDGDARFRIINMSDKPVSVASVLLYVARRGNARTVEVTGRDLAGGARGENEHVPRFPGSLGSGESFDLGSAAQLLAVGERSVQPGREPDAERAPDDPSCFELRLVLQHGASDYPGAVMRPFRFERLEQGWRVVPDGTTRLWYSRRGRKVADQWLECTPGFRNERS